MQYSHDIITRSPMKKNISGRFAEKCLSRKLIYQGSFLRVMEDTVELPNKHHAKREYLLHPGAAVILPLFENGDVLFVRQYRYPVGKEILEVPAGKLDAEEEPLLCAQRELLEETGYKAENWTKISTFEPVAGYSNEVMHLYKATELQFTEANPDEDEFLESCRIPFHEALEKVIAGELCDGKTMIALLLAAQLRSQPEKR